MIPALPEARLRALLAAYGADPARWPADERDAARAALAADPALAVARDDAARLDAALAELPPPPAPALNPLAIAAAAQAAEKSRKSVPGPGFRGAGAAATPGRSRGNRVLEPVFGRLWPRAAGLAAAALVGFVVGWSGMGATERDDRLAFLAGIEEDVL